MIFVHLFKLLLIFQSNYVWSFLLAVTSLGSLLRIFAALPPLLIVSLYASSQHCASLQLPPPPLQPLNWLLNNQCELCKVSHLTKGPDFSSLGPLSSLHCALGPGSLGQNLKVRAVHKPPGACTAGTVNWNFILALGQKKQQQKKISVHLSFRWWEREKKEINSLVAAFLARAPLLKRCQSQWDSIKVKQSIKTQHCWKVLPLPECCL